MEVNNYHLELCDTSNNNGELEELHLVHYRITINYAYHNLYKSIG